MKNILLLLILFTFSFCSDYRKPSRTEKKCLINNLGEVQTQKLLESLRKYHRVNGKATLLDYILERRPEMKEIADKCLLKVDKKDRRRLDYNLQDAIDSALNNSMVNYYLESILRDQELKSELISELNKENGEALKACKDYLESEEMCKMVLSLLAESIEKKQAD